MLTVLTLDELKELETLILNISENYSHPALNLELGTFLFKVKNEIQNRLS